MSRQRGGTVLTFHRLVLCGREEVRVSRAHGEASHGANMASQSQLETTFSTSAAFSQVPDLEQA